jgi:hypothetical protein
MLLLFKALVAFPLKKRSTREFTSQAAKSEIWQHTLKQRYFSFEEVQYAFNSLMIR